MAAFHKRRLTNFLQEIVHLPANRKITALQRLSFEFQNINDFATIICESEEVVKVLIDTVLESDQNDPLHLNLVEEVCVLFCKFVLSCPRFVWAQVLPKIETILPVLLGFIEKNSKLREALSALHEIGSLANGSPRWAPHFERIARREGTKRKISVIQSDDVTVMALISSLTRLIWKGKLSFTFMFKLGTWLSMKRHS